MTTPAWRNLGLWAPGRTYESAQIALADRVGDVELEGRAVVELGCGTGAGLNQWRRRGAARAIGYDPAARASDSIRSSPAHALDEPSDVVLAVDAAYHFDLLRTAHAVGRSLRPGGVFRFTDFVIDADSRRARTVAWAIGRACRFGPGAPRTEDELRALLVRAGLTWDGIEDLTEEVLGGFVDYVGDGTAIARHDRRRYTVTAHFARWVLRTRAARYVLVRARRD